MRLFEAVTRGLDEFAQCVGELRAANETPQITVSASVAFSYYWLMPRLERFAQCCPNIDLRVLATDQQADLQRGETDIAVLYGDGHWDGVETQRLFGERVYPVCSPMIFWTKRFCILRVVETSGGPSIGRYGWRNRV